MKLSRVQVTPPSRVVNMADGSPASWLVPPMRMCRESNGSIAMTPMRRGRPALLDEAMSDQLAPASRDR